ncbi:unnamed protein product [Rhizoctonia solani]|uniref:Uncharacterized protein n=1 Tax=Rhizoctonia solani TaxID=456999 RepID=A0A8H2XIL9_9AGAM|nr:unnamed protein product [Rhizoctonia solani]
MPRLRKKHTLATSNTKAEALSYALPSLYIVYLGLPFTPTYLFAMQVHPSLNIRNIYLGSLHSATACLRRAMVYTAVDTGGPQPSNSGLPPTFPNDLGPQLSGFSIRRLTNKASHAWTVIGLPLLPSTVSTSGGCGIILAIGARESPGVDEHSSNLWSHPTVVGGGKSPRVYSGNYTHVSQAMCSIAHCLLSVPCQWGNGFGCILPLPSLCSERRL